MAWNCRVDTKVIVTLNEETEIDIMKIILNEEDLSLN